MNTTKAVLSVFFKGNSFPVLLAMGEDFYGLGEHLDSLVDEGYVATLCDPDPDAIYFLTESGIRQFNLQYSEFPWEKITTDPLEIYSVLLTCLDSELTDMDQYDIVSFAKKFKNVVDYVSDTDYSKWLVLKSNALGMNLDCGLDNPVVRILAKKYQGIRLGNTIAVSDLSFNPGKAILITSDDWRSPSADEINQLTAIDILYYS